MFRAVDHKACLTQRFLGILNHFVVPTLPDERERLPSKQTLVQHLITEFGACWVFPIRFSKHGKPVNGAPTVVVKNRQIQCRIHVACVHQDRHFEGIYGKIWLLRRVQCHAKVIPRFGVSRMGLGRFLKNFNGLVGFSSLKHISTMVEQLRQRTPRGFLCMSHITMSPIGIFLAVRWLSERDGLPSVPSRPAPLLGPQKNRC